MICQRQTPILLITPNHCLSGGVSESISGDTRWLTYRAAKIGEVLRSLRMHRPDVLVLDVSKPHATPLDHVEVFRLIPAVRSRVPRMPIVVLSASQDQTVERSARELGATAFLPIDSADSRARARRFIESLHPREGLVQTHGPPQYGPSDTPTPHSS